MQECPISRSHAVFGLRAASTLALPRREKFVGRAAFWMCADPAEGEVTYDINWVIQRS